MALREVISSSCDRTGRLLPPLRHTPTNRGRALSHVRDGLRQRPSVMGRTRTGKGIAAREAETQNPDECEGGDSEGEVKDRSCREREAWRFERS